MGASDFKRPPCLECGKATWIAIPDSLAIACISCGAVLVQGGSYHGYKPGASLQQWAEDLYNAQQTKEIGGNDA